MSDLVYRLRNPAFSWTNSTGSQFDKEETLQDLTDAADEIERLQVDAAHWKERHDTVLQKHIECCGDPAQGKLDRKSAAAAAEAIFDYTDNNLTMMDACDMDTSKAEELFDAAKRLRDMLASPLPSTGLPATAPHAEVREALTPFAKIAESYESSIERANRAIIDEAKCAGRGPVEDHALKQPLPDAHRVSVTIGDCRLARSVLAALPQQDRGGK